MTTLLYSSGLLYVGGKPFLKDNSVVTSWVSEAPESIVFVPGCHFYTNPMEGVEIMRLNYTVSDVETIDAAIKKLSFVIKDVD